MKSAVPGFDDGAGSGFLGVDAGGDAVVREAFTRVGALITGFAADFKRSGKDFLLSSDLAVLGSVVMAAGKKLMWRGALEGV